MISFRFVVGAVFLCLFSVGAIAQERLTRSSCGTANCHSGPLDVGESWNHSLTQFVARDPHSLAGLVLHSELSQKIVRRLSADANSVDTKAYGETLRKRCISCHTTATVSEVESTTGVRSMLIAEGVSCESCHGLASKWIEPHLMSDWKSSQRNSPNSEAALLKSEHRQLATGFRDNSSIIGRAETCVRCHVGSRRDDGFVRDMNHDLIAAGHPALRFDFVTYLDNLPSHWSPKGPGETAVRRSTTLTRLVGREVGLSAAARLTAERATDHLNNRDVVWPELSDYSCFGCHQSLQYRDYLTSDNQPTPASMGKNVPMWNNWHTAKIADDQALGMHTNDIQQVADRATQVAAVHRTKAKELVLSQLQENGMTNAVRSRIKILLAARHAPRDWTEAAIRYLDFEAAFRDLAEINEMRDTGEHYLDRLRSVVEPALRFDQVDGPSESSRTSPASFHSQRHAKLFRSALAGSTDSPRDQTAKKLLTQFLNGQ